MKILLRTLDDCERIMEIGSFKPEVYTALMRPIRALVREEAFVPEESEVDTRKYTYSGKTAYGIPVYIET